MKKWIISMTAVLLFGSFSRLAAQNDREEVRQVVDRFFLALERSDSSSFRNLFVESARQYYVQQRGDSVIAGSQSPFRFKFDTGRQIKQQLRKSSVKIELRNRVAYLWGIYDLWMNGRYAHCGTDLFSLIKTREGWQISSISFTVETTGCR
ncbi:MAG TPA: nuclear transport factor 2 family protein [Chitinophagaceae bacterium]|nr:nuclear transport factor 2 family protein [Chitinophagaceae bacterium]